MKLSEQQAQKGAQWAGGKTHSNKAQVMQIPKALGEIRLPAAKASQNIKDTKEGLGC